MAAGVVAEGGGHGLLHQGLGGRAGPVVEAHVDAVDHGVGREKRGQGDDGQRGGEAEAALHGCCCF